MKNSNLTFVLSAPSGAGKSTIIRKLLGMRNDLDFSISTTTRKMRTGETEGVNYYFTTADDFESKIKNDEFVEWAKVHDNYYGTSKKEIDRIHASNRIPVLDIDVQGAEIVKSRLEKGIFVFIIPPSLSVLRERLVGRNTDSADQIELRLKNAVEEIEKYTLYDYIIVNDELDNAVQNLNSIISSCLLRLDVMGSRAAKLLEEKIDNTIG